MKQQVSSIEFDYSQQPNYDNGLTAQLTNEQTSHTKPRCPPALSCALGLWLTCAIILTIGQAWATATWLYVSCIGFILLLPAVVLLVCKNRALFTFFLLGCLLGFCLSGSSVLFNTSTVEDLYDTTQNVKLIVTKDASAGLYGQNAEVSLKFPDGRVIAAQGRFPSDTSTVRYGDCFNATVSLSKPGGTSVDFTWQSGCFLIAKIKTLEPSADDVPLRAAILNVRNSILETLNTISGDEPALIGALACGYRKNLSENAYQSFKVCGLAHVIAVSGAHLSLVCAFVGCILQRFSVRKTLSIVLQLGFILAYLILAGLPISALRAAVMTSLSLCSFFAKRRPYALNALALCIIAFISLNPFTALSVSFALSAGSTLGILLFSGLFGQWIQRFAPKMPRLFRDALALTFASNIITLPLSAAWFSQVSLIAPLANVLTSPFFAPLCTLSLICALLSLFIPSATALLFGPLCLLLRAFLTLVHGIAAIPYAAIPATLSLGVGLLCALGLTLTLWIFWPKPPNKPTLPSFASKKRLILIATCISLCTILTLGFLKPPTPDCELRMLDVGQGDALLLRSRGATLLVDTGNQDSLLLQALARASVAHLDGVLITHDDDDHMGSLDCLQGVVSVDNVIVARDALNCACSNCARLRDEANNLVGIENIHGVQMGDSLQCGAFEVNVIWPQSFQDEGGNADSICLLALTDINSDGIQDHSILLTGDAEYQQMNELLKRNLVGDIDVYKVGHHGSKNALDENSVQLLNPELALISAGANNRYGHPSQVTLDHLETVEACIMRTDTYGDVSCEFNLDGIHVTTQR